MEKTYYLLTEGDDTVIGVVGCSNNDELNQKVTQAINSHFDIETDTIISLDMEDYIYGRQGEFQIKLESENDDDYNATIFIQSVEVY